MELLLYMWLLVEIIEILKELIAAGADVNIDNPLLLASSRNIQK